MSKIKNAWTVAIVLLAIFGIEQALNAGARANDRVIYIRDDPSVIEELVAYFLPENEYLYTKECASCHFLYSPGLLPAKAWYNILKKSDSHFGKNLNLPYKTERELTLYLTDNSTDRGLMSAREEVALGLRDKDGKTPSRVSETTYIRDTHSEIDPKLFTRNAAKDLSNCGACHAQERDLSTLIYR